MILYSPVKLPQAISRCEASYHCPKDNFTRRQANITEAHFLAECASPGRGNRTRGGRGIFSNALREQALLQAAGAKGKRLALPNARILIHQPAMEGMQGQASDIQIVADEIDRMRAWLEDTISKHSGKPVEQVRRDIERDKILTAPQAAEYGLIDQVLESRKAL